MGYPFPDSMKKFLLWLFAVAMLLTAIAANAVLPFMQDDFSHARAQAMQRKLPIFVECWAPW